MRKNLNEEEFKKLVKHLIDYKKKIDENPEIQMEIREKGEEYQKRYGTLTEKELSITITI